MCENRQSPNTKSGGPRDLSPANHSGTVRAGGRTAAPLGSAKEFVGRTTDGPSRFKLQRHAAGLTNHGGLSSCMWLVAFGASGAAIRGTPRGDGLWDNTRLRNLAVCGSHLCPVCGPRVAAQRRDEVGTVLEKAKEVGGLVPVLLTLTARHKAGDSLAALLGPLKEAQRRWRNHRAHKAFRRSTVGTVSAFEVTHGRNGWHPHFHLLVFIKADSPAKALRSIAALRSPWSAALDAVGLSCGRAGFKAVVAWDGGRYLAKWDASKEMTKAQAKTAKQGGRSPAQLLRDSHEGDKRAGRLWAEWAAAMKGRSVLRFSPGLKDWAGVGTVSDEEAATLEEEEVERLITVIETDKWQAAKRAGLCRDSLLRSARLGHAGVRDYLSGLSPSPIDRSDRQESGKGNGGRSQRDRSGLSLDSPAAEGHRPPPGP